MNYNQGKYIDNSKCKARRYTELLVGDTLVLQPPHHFAGSTGITATVQGLVPMSDEVRCVVEVFGHDGIHHVESSMLPTCHVCKRVCLSSDSVTGYAIDYERTLLACYECCARSDLDYMQTHDKVSFLYLTSEDDVSVGGGPRKRWYVSNWPGSLKIPCFSHVTSKGNGFGGSYPMHDAWFWLDMPNGTRSLWWMRVKGNMQCGVACRIKPRGKYMLAIAAGL